MELSPQQDVYYIDTVSPIDYFIDTVTPSAIQLNKEKTMSIELDGPLYLGSNSLQQQVDQNTKDITELQSDVSSIEGDIGSLDNLATSDKSSLVNAINETLSVLDPTQTADYIKNSKGLESGEISTNASILPWVEEMSHSTFDKSKFTVVGSPVITDDGIASGFSESNYLTVPVDFSRPFKIELPILTSNSWQTNTNCYPCRSNTNGLYIQISANGYLTVNVGDTAWTPNIISRSMQLSLNTKYIISLEWTGTTYIVKVNGTQIGDIVSSTTQILNATFLLLGGYPEAAISYSFNGSIDLKQFSITVDGVEVFSGNKTGIDTIKPDDYQVVGAPIISADGIVSGFSGSNYLTIPQHIDLSKPFKIKGKFTTKTDVTSSQFIFAFPYPNNLFAFGIHSDGKFIVYFGSTGSNFTFGDTATANTTYYYEFVHNGTSLSIKMGTSEDNLTPFPYSPVTPNSFATTTSEYIGTNSSHTSNWQDSIDLNSFKIYVDGNLVYQPCLKIPYTESKTGSKIVNSIYRDRVNDMAEQFGFANYYTLQEDAKSNYTVVGSPTISSDFVASGFSNRNYLRTRTIDFSKPWEITTRFMVSAEGAGAVWLVQSSGWYNNIYVGALDNIACALKLSDNSEKSLKIDYSRSVDVYYDYIVGWSGTTYYVKLYNIDGTLLQEKTTNSTLTLNVTSGYVQLGFGTSGNYTLNGSIDLNSFKIYVDNKLAYEAVIDPNFTLPQVELYGLIGQRTLRDSYRNGATYWELWSDRTLEIGGTCTSGVEYNLPKNFTSENDYILSVPYSAKTASSFTPTASGDFIAKGLGVL